MGRKNHLKLPAGWGYVCRTAQSTVATWDGETFRLDTLGACSKPGTLIALQEVKITRDAYGPVMVLCCWAKGYQEPLYLVSNMDTAERACYYYQKRFRIETFFSDQKSRGFHIHKSHISNPQRLSRLLIATCLAYIWVVSLGALCEKEAWRELIHQSLCVWICCVKALSTKLKHHPLEKRISPPYTFFLLNGDMELNRNQ